MRKHLLRCAVSSLLALACAPALAQGEASGFSTAGSAGQRPDDGQSQVRRFDLWPEADGVGRGALATLPRLIGDAPVAEHGVGGAPTPLDRIEAGALSARRSGAVLRFEQRLASRWLLGGEVGVSRNRLRQQQTEVTRSSPAPNAPQLFLHSDTTVTLNAQHAALTMAWLPTPQAFVDAGVATSRANIDALRVADSDLSPYIGNASAHAFGVAIGAGWVAALDPAWSLVPRLGLEQVDSHIGSLAMGRFTLSPQSQRESSMLASVQLQRAFQLAGARMVPLARLAWRNRLALSADRVAQDAPDLFVGPGPPRYLADAREGDPAALAGKRTVQFTLGLSARLASGVGAFIEWSRARSQPDTADTALLVGLRFSP